MLIHQCVSFSTVAQKTMSEKSVWNTTSTFSLSPSLIVVLLHWLIFQFAVTVKFHFPGGAQTIATSSDDTLREMKVRLMEKIVKKGADKSIGSLDEYSFKVSFQSITSPSSPNHHHHQLSFNILLILLPLSMSISHNGVLCVLADG